MINVLLTRSANGEAPRQCLRRGLEVPIKRYEVYVPIKRVKNIAIRITGHTNHYLLVIPAVPLPKNDGTLQRTHRTDESRLGPIL